MKKDKKTNILIFLKAAIYLLDGLLLNKILYDYNKRIKALETKSRGLAGQQDALSKKMAELANCQKETTEKSKTKPVTLNGVRHITMNAAEATDTLQQKLATLLKTFTDQDIPQNAVHTILFKDLSADDRLVAFLQCCCKDGNADITLREYSCSLTPFGGTYSRKINLNDVDKTTAYIAEQVHHVCMQNKVNNNEAIYGEPDDGKVKEKLTKFILSATDNPDKAKQLTVCPIIMRDDRIACAINILRKDGKKLTFEIWVDTNTEDVITPLPLDVNWGNLDGIIDSIYDQIVGAVSACQKHKT